MLHRVFFEFLIQVWGHGLVYLPGGMKIIQLSLKSGNQEPVLLCLDLEPASAVRCVRQPLDSSFIHSKPDGSSCHLES